MAAGPVEDGVGPLPRRGRGGCRFDDVAVLEDQDPVREDQGFVHVVGHEQHRRAVATVQSLHQTLHVQPGEGVEGAEGLVRSRSSARGPRPGPGMLVAPHHQKGSGARRRPAPPARARRARHGPALCRWRP